MVSVSLFCLLLALVGGTAAQEPLAIPTEKCSGLVQVLGSVTSVLGKTKLSSGSNGIMEQSFLQTATRMDSRGGTETAGTTEGSAMCSVSLFFSLGTLFANIACVWFGLKVNSFFNDTCRRCHVKELMRGNRPQTLRATIPTNLGPGDLMEVQVNGDGWQDKKSMTVQLPPDAKPGTPVLIVTDDSTRTSALCVLCKAGSNHWNSFKRYVLIYFVFDIFSSIAMRYCSLRTTAPAVQYLIGVESMYMSPHFWPVHSSTSHPASPQVLFQRPAEDAPAEGNAADPDAEDMPGLG